MKLRKIMIPFVETGTCDAAFDAGLTLAKHFGSHLDVVHTRPRIVMPDGLYYPVVVPYIEANYDALSEATTRAARELKARFDDLCSRHKLAVLDTDKAAAGTAEPAASWVEYEARSIYDLGNRARLRDLTVMVRPVTVDRHDEYGLMESILFQSARPLLVLDGDRRMKRVPATVVLAWNGGLEATRALSAARPFLATAQSVTVVAVGDIAEEGLSAEEAARYLQLHDIAARGRTIRRDMFKRPENEFMALIEAERPELVVMGAYSHSRAREAILGGFTRHLLHDANCPVLLCH
jgi:nucleotide-binding universal stress UspA family protein